MPTPSGPATLLTTLAAGAKALTTGATVLTTGAATSATLVAVDASFETVGATSATTGAVSAIAVSTLATVAAVLGGRARHLSGLAGFLDDLHHIALPLDVLETELAEGFAHLHGITALALLDDVPHVLVDGRLEVGGLHRAWILDLADRLAEDGFHLVDVAETPGQERVCILGH